MLHPLVASTTNKYAILSPMTLNQWDENILILELQDEPDFSEDMDALLSRLKKFDDKSSHIIIDLQKVDKIHSMNLSTFIEVHSLIRTKNRRMIICNLSDSVWSTMLATGLDQVFEFIEDTTTALASLTFED